MAEPPSRLRGHRVIVTAGGTREAIDPVRYLGNRSSGRMGAAVAAEAAARGAHVELISTVDLPTGAGVTLTPVESAADMDRAVRAALPGAAVLVMTAAVADYRAEHIAATKLKKSDGLTLHLVPTVDILRGLRDDPVRAGVFVVGFAAETDDLEANARGKLIAKGLNLIVVNDVGRSDIGMGAEDNEVTILGADGLRVDVPRRPKREVAAAILDVVDGCMAG